MKSIENGQVFEVTSCNSPFEKGSIVVVAKAETIDSSRFDLVKGDCEYNHGIHTTKGAWDGTYSMTRLYPPEEKVETISLMGKEYAKADIESALANVTSIK